MSTSVWGDSQRKRELDSVGFLVFGQDLQDLQDFLVACGKGKELDSI
jgi:hypothetical protein